MSIGVTVFLVLAAIVGIEAALLYFLIRRNAQYRERQRMADQAIRQANEQLGRMSTLMEDREHNRQEAEREKNRIDRTEDSDLVHDANSLFPGSKLSDD